MAQRVKNPPAIQKTQVQSLGQEDPREKGMATHSSILAWRIPIDRGAWGLTSPWGCKESDVTKHMPQAPHSSLFFTGSFSQLNTFKQWRSLPSSPPPPSPPRCLVQVYQKCLCCVFLPLTPTRCSIHDCSLTDRRQGDPYFSLPPQQTHLQSRGKGKWKNLLCALPGTS